MIRLQGEGVLCGEWGALASESRFRASGSRMGCRNCPCGRLFQRADCAKSVGLSRDLVLSEGTVADWEVVWGAVAKGCWWSVGERVAFFGRVQAVWVAEIARAVVYFGEQVEQIDCILSRACFN